MDNSPMDNSTSTNNLTPTLTEPQIRANLNALEAAGQTVQQRQAYVDNYQKGTDGNYQLKTTQPAQPTPESRGAVKQADGTYRGPTFMEGLKQAAIGAGNFVGQQAIGLGQAALSVPGPAIPGGNMRQQAIQTGEDLKTQMNPQNQAQQGGATAANVGEIALPLAGTAASAIENAPKILEAGKGLIGKLAGKSAESTALDAVTPSLKGKQLVGAYTSDFGEGAKSATLLGKQTAPVSNETQRLATNLQDVLTSKKPLENLHNLGQDMAKTESTLGPLLQNDKTPLDIKSITTQLESAKTNMPREFQAIKDNKRLFQSVIDFGKQTLAESDGTINGGREARIAFDMQAKTEFPSAFTKNGFIDTSKPAGRAIKLTRDIINSSIYDTAQNGSQIKNLIGREADIYKATQTIGQKAAATEGKTAIQSFFKEHPTFRRIVGWGIAGTVGGEVLKHTGVLP